MQGTMNIKFLTKYLDHQTKTAKNYCCLNEPTVWHNVDTADH